jgi:hypothetical protein
MKKGRALLTLTLALLATSVAWAQDDTTPPPAASPAPAFGQENSVPLVTDNPPISGLDQPGLEPHAAPESFLLTGLHFSESVDSNVGNNLGSSSTGVVTRGMGSVTLQKLWKNYDVAVDYIGGVADYANVGVGLEQLQQFDMDNRINWKRGQFGIRDSFSYLPEGTFGFGAYGGGSAYNAGFGSLGSGMLGSGAFGGTSSAFNGGSGITIGEVPRLTNLGLVDVVEELSPKSSVTAVAGYGLVHFYGDLNSSVTGAPLNIDFVGSREETGQVAYDRTLNAKDQVAISYGYQGFDFSTVGTAFHSNVIQLMYGHRISGRMDFMIGAGPQFTHIDSNATECSFLGIPIETLPGQCFTGEFVTVHQSVNHIGAAGRVSLRYRFPKATVSLSYQRFTTNGNGVFAGSLSDIVHADAQRRITRVWDLFSDFGYSKNSRVQLAGSTVAADKFQDGYAGVGLHRQFGRSLRAFASYQYNYLSFDTECPIPGTSGAVGGCSNHSQRSVGSIGLDWTPRPIRLD